MVWCRIYFYKGVASSNCIDHVPAEFHGRHEIRCDTWNGAVALAQEWCLADRNNMASVYDFNDNRIGVDRTTDFDSLFVNEDEEA